MDLLDVPTLEAVAFRLYSLPGAAAGLVWAWAAVLAAALGLWGMRTVGTKSDAFPLSHSAPRSSSPPQPAIPCPAVPAEPSKPQAAPINREDYRPIAGYRVEEASATKARFTAYYHGASSCNGCGAVEEDECDEGDARGVERWVAAPWDQGWRWEALTVRRRWDLGWYRYLDMTALNGSVVRLWDGADGGLTARRRPPQNLI
ncbi:hypothetical protein OPV22_026082 [Ensete ventricosum]|uniref:Uncharacterized protein n=1 Tax=Ensete ventricosum TaxID=4639 RepID=A0AAV8QKN6_ENSVE|nr:hypothetical protein OPV22_026082 [Ensete ventricosum]